MASASLVRYKADYYTIATVLFYAFYLPASWILFPQVGWLGKLALVASHCVYQFVVVCIIHNTIHVPIFRKMNWNRAFQLYLSAIHGNPVSGFVPGHNLSHSIGKRRNTHHAGPIRLEFSQPVSISFPCSARHYAVRKEVCESHEGRQTFMVCSIQN